MTLRLSLVGALFLLGCGGDAEVSGGGSCPTCGGTPSFTTATSCEKRATLASGPSKRSGDGGGSGGGPTTTTTTTTGGGTPFAAPVVNVNTPPSSSSSVSIVCGSSTAPAP
jgi:hypothetical protein